jgi:ABC-type antimicrobial peptide transport system permease subunit
MTLHVRTADAKATAATILREMQRLAPEVVVQMEPMSEAVGAAVMPARIGAMATAASGAVAMLLSTLGIYGLVAFVVVQRTREIGVRRALGASTPAILRLVVGGMARVTGVGLLVGLVVGVLGGALLGGLIVGVSPADPANLLSVAALILAATIPASTFPALRAAAVDPLVALREE